MTTEEIKYALDDQFEVLEGIKDVLLDIESHLEDIADAINELTKVIAK